MAERFSVDFGWLDALIAAFDGSTRATDAALDALHETGPIRTGHKDLDKACDHFNGKWEKRVKDFRGDIAKFRAVVENSKSMYGVTEQHVATSMARFTSGAPAPGQPAAASPGGVESSLRAVLDPTGSATPSGASPTAPAPSRIGEVLG
ncbi:hypothetical protein [Embleya sp. NPDC005575]|uniref:hypothetical protein n=1 Tax=Embleya sp. NPDC005575 TaxID=3156892 RepID=UPI0033BE5989